MNRRAEPERIVRNRVYQEWEAFMAEILKYDKQTIVGICDKIHFYDCVVIFFLGAGQISGEDIDFLYQKEHIIFSMWLTCLHHEKSEFMAWPQLAELLKLWQEDERGDGNLCRKKQK